MIEQPCPVCKLEHPHVRVFFPGATRTALVECNRCGKFHITTTAISIFSQKADNHRLSAWIRARAESDQEPPEITSKTEVELLSDLPSYRVSEKLLLLIQVLDRRSAFPGEIISLIPEWDYPIAWASGKIEFDYLLQSLINRGLVNLHSIGGSIGDTFSPNISITTEGWDYIDQHSRDHIVSNQVFIAMSFSDNLRSAWEIGIRDTLLGIGYRPYRVDAQPHLDRVDVKIMAEIKNSKFVVADVTGQRPGVYFEAGYALGLGLPVIWCVREDDLKNIHFDTRQYNHIVWNSEDQLATELENFVLALIGRGTSKKK
jgi:nucleoside 2-deoxyribosyltransferase